MTQIWALSFRSDQCPKNPLEWEVSNPLHQNKLFWASLPQLILTSAYYCRNTIPLLLVGWQGSEKLNCILSITT